MITSCKALSANDNAIENAYDHHQRNKPSKENGANVEANDVEAKVKSFLLENMEINKYQYYQQ